ncbi:5-methylcytosine restriction system specificity protein McrC [Tuwongella immobilis]|uniref:McrBC 5-methylcytosine restriction system component n=1 Tax=Tuwongella immobilis TaxID=692036 RepID=A0A6C2YRV1_9BACT|nr:hypothetical protein [Tuwongella immobilis]VIP03853.1 Putative McrC protein OS=Mobilicoccus pelagius NBRC 104925 GN=MOPEL_003_00020 PE=4 SV=1: McrBC [Tuwongella immobilis]VTS05073.1 Putative McrC protein OS=Mobilicoccus pelagius NBRC 104925 GN=MOPEL_003_00020 PE=4 SV=1: McrBC [Tuwongella immobilis]
MTARRRIRLVERRTQRVRLPGRIVQQLHIHLGPKIRILPDGGSNVWQITPLGIAGRVVIDDWQIEIAPKLSRIAVAQLFQVTEFEPTAPFRNPAEAESETESEGGFWLNLLACQFAGRMQALAAAGFATVDRLTPEIESHLRGSIDLPAQLRQPSPYPTQFHQQIWQASHDYPVGQIAKTVAQWLLAFPELTAASRARLGASLRDFADFSEMRNPRLALDDCLARPLRLVERACLESCRDLLSGALAPGCFWLDLESAWERWITGQLREVAESAGHSVAAQSACELPPIDGSSPTMRLIPDVVIRTAGGRIVVVDAKWKSGPVESSDLHQILAYVQRMGAESGHLLYPAHRAKHHAWSCSPPPMMADSESAKWVGAHWLPLVGSSSRVRQGVRRCLQTILRG